MGRSWRGGLEGKSLAGPLGSATTILKLYSRRPSKRCAAHGESKKRRHGRQEGTVTQGTSERHLEARQAPFCSCSWRACLLSSLEAARINSVSATDTQNNRWLKPRSSRLHLHTKSSKTSSETSPMNNTRPNMLDTRQTKTISFRNGLVRQLREL